MCHILQHIQRHLRCRVFGAASLLLELVPWCTVGNRMTLNASLMHLGCITQTYCCPLVIRSPKMHLICYSKRWNEESDRQKRRKCFWSHKKADDDIFEMTDTCIQVKTCSALLLLCLQCLWCLTWRRYNLWIIDQLCCQREELGLLRQNGVGVSLIRLPAQKLPANGAEFLWRCTARGKWFDI